MVGWRFKRSSCFFFSGRKAGRGGARAEQFLVYWSRDSEKEKERETEEESEGIITREIVITVSRSTAIGA